MEEREISYTLGGTEKWSSHFVNQCGELKINLPYNPGILLLGMTRFPIPQIHVHPYLLVLNSQKLENRNNLHVLQLRNG